MVASIFLMLPGCASVSHPSASSRIDTPGDMAPAVRVVDVSDHAVKERPNPVDETEVSRARAALRDAVAWGAQYYEPRMYDKAQAAFDAAAAAREQDPARCRSLLAETTAAADAAREAALAAYEDDVNARFEASVKKLIGAGADRAFPDEFSRLATGITATARQFAAKSYWDARMAAYTTLKGMEDLYEKVDRLRMWLHDSKGQVGNEIEAARALGAATWAPSQMKDAEQKYQDALVQMREGDLPSAADSMKAAGFIAARLPLLRNQTSKATGGPAAVVQAPRSTPPQRGGEAAGPAPVLQPRTADVLPSGQRVRIGEMSMSPLGAPQKLYTSFSAAVARFDVVAAEGLRDAGVMEKVLAGLGDSWEAAVSRNGYFGFIYNDKIQMVKDLGTYEGEGRFLHAPYAAQFRLVGTRFRINLVICPVESSGDRAGGTDAMAGLAEMHRYYENLTGNHGITILVAGGVVDPSGQRPDLRTQNGEIAPMRARTASKSDKNDASRMFGSSALQPLVETSGLGPSTPRVAYLILAGR